MDINAQIGHTDCKSKLFRLFRVPHKFILVKNNMKVYELLRMKTGLIKINIEDWASWLRSNNVWGMKQKFAINKQFFDKLIERLKTWEGKQYSLLNRNCYHFVNEIVRKAGIK